MTGTAERQTQPIEKSGTASVGSVGVLSSSAPAGSQASHLQVVPDEKPPNPECETYLRQGVAALQQNRLEAAARAFERAVRADPGADLAHDYLGIAYLKQHRFDAALHQFQEEIRLEPGGAAGWARVSDVYVAQGNLPRAVKAMEKAVALAPDMAQFHFNLGVLYQQVLELTKGIAEFNRCVALEPGNHYAYYLRGNLLYKLVRLDEAEQSLQEAIRLEPRIGTYHFALAQVYLRREVTTANIERARAELERALELGADQSAEAHYDLGLCYKRQGHLDAALQELQLAVKMAPEAFSACYELQDVLRQLGRTAEAQRVQARFLVLRQKADAQRKREFYTQEVQRNPDSPDARYQLAEYLAETGDRAQARQALERAQMLSRGKPGLSNLRQRMAALAAQLQRPTP